MVSAVLRDIMHDSYEPQSIHVLAVIYEHQHEVIAIIELEQKYCLEYLSKTASLFLCMKRFWIS